MHEKEIKIRLADARAFGQVLRALGEPKATRRQWNHYFDTTEATLAVEHRGMLRIREDGTRRTLALKLGADGKVGGLLESKIGDGELEEGRFDAETGKLRFQISNDEMVVAFEATVEEGLMSGTILGPGGSFHYTFEAEREEKRIPARCADAKRAE